ncbi:MAG: CDP-alcohol phosphatidyltransferase family protein [Proteobacteria bacterium]|nr:CDP-alcohol phosphatidyltransferase family protein [Pseudomonadota bacterium]
MTAGRAALAPVLLALAWHWPARGAFAFCLIVAFLSDIFDGVLARKWGIATTALRRFDSLADSLFYAAAIAAAWRLYPTAILARWPWLVALLALELARYAFDYFKYRREASYHMWSSKLWGVSLFVAFFWLLALGTDNASIDFAILLGIVCDLEGLAISFVLRDWHHDVPSIVHALRIRDT